MSSNTLFILITILFDGVAVVWAIREFRSARPTKPKPEPPPAVSSESSPERSGHPEG